MRIISVNGHKVLCELTADEIAYNLSACGASDSGAIDFDTPQDEKIAREISARWYASEEYASLFKSRQRGDNA